MSETNLLNFKVIGKPSSHLEIEIINNQVLNEALLIEIKIPIRLVDPQIRTAREKARISSQPKLMASLAGIVTISGGLSAWVYYTDSDDIVALRIVNYLDQKTGAVLKPPVKIEANTALKLRIPLTQQSSSTQYTLPYVYKHGQGKPVNDSLAVTPDTGEWKPEVSFTIDNPNPTMLKPASKVKISWKIKDGVSATLRGPLPGGHSQIPLNSNPTSDFQIKEGSIEIYAVGLAIYLLEAEVKPPRSNQNVHVIRTLILDITSSDQHSYLSVRPKRVLPYGQILVHWAVWGVASARIRIANRRSLKLDLTEQDLTHKYQGTGWWKEQALNINETVKLILENTNFEDLKADIEVAAWQAVTNPKPKYTGKPVGLAVVAPNMALLTSDGLWIGKVGKDDKDLTSPNFRKISTDKPKAWIALSTFKQSFIALQQTNQDGLQLVRYSSDGKPQGEPVNLPDFIMLILRYPGAVFDLVGFSNRVYVIAERFVPGGSIREALSVSYDDDNQGTWHSERLLSQLQHYRLAAFADALYGLNRDSGHMLRFIVPEDGEIEEAHRAASATNAHQSLIRTGLLVPLADLLLVLDPESVSPFKSSALFDMVNIWDFVLKNLTSDSNQKKAPQDLVYNPQKDQWEPCGQGLQIKSGAVAAFRGGNDERLWVLQPDGELHTLMEAQPQLFAADYVQLESGMKFPSASLPPALNAKKVFQIRNNSATSLSSMDMGGFDFGLQEVNSASMVDIDPSRVQLRDGFAQTFEIRYHKTDPTPIRQRFMVYSDTLGPRYFLEVTFSGHDLSSITSVFKRIAADEAGVVSITPVFDTWVQYPADRPVDERFLRDWRRNHKGEPDPERPIVIPPAKRFAERAKLILYNLSRLDLMKGSDAPPLHSYREMKIDYTTTSFSITGYQPTDYHRLGKLKFDINFALPHGIETSSGNFEQKSMIRINPDQSTGLEVKFIKMLAPGDPPVEVRYMFNGEEQKATVSATKDVVYVCQIDVNK
jgi:hypothetical protein